MPERLQVSTAYKVKEATKEVLEKPMNLGERKPLKKIKRVLKDVRAKEKEFKKEFSELTDDQFDRLAKKKTQEFKDRIKDGETFDAILPEVFAVGLEAIRRKLEMDLYDEQIMGSIALHKGYIAEMKTGEGKTYISILAAYLNALDPNSKGIHVATASEFLAKRDYELVKPVHESLGLTVDITQRIEPTHVLGDLVAQVIKKQKAYEADITFGHGNEFGFDFERDKIAKNTDDRFQKRGRGFIIVDEVDSELLDEARTPLIITEMPLDFDEDKIKQFAELVSKMSPTKLNEDGNFEEGHYDVDLNKNSVTITQRGIDFLKEQGIDNLFGKGTAQEIEASIRLSASSSPDISSQDKEVVESLEESTRLYAYLNDALKAKELYKDDRDYIVRDNEIIAVGEYSGRLLYGRRLNARIHQAIEAKESLKEGQEIEIKPELEMLASMPLQNYFLEYDKLSGMTGTASTEAGELYKTFKGLRTVPIPTHLPVIREDKEDMVFKSETTKNTFLIDEILERHDNGQPVLVCTRSIRESEYIAGLLESHGIDRQTINVLNAKQDQQEADIISRAGTRGAVTITTQMAGRGVDIMLGGPKPSKKSPEYADWEKANQEVLDLGGLYIPITGLFDSRRILDQVRGRGGRQGDPGETRLFLSLQDPLLQKYYGGTISQFVDQFPDHFPVINGRLKNMIRDTQLFAEKDNRDERKQAIQYDEVLKRQRDVYFAQREEVLKGENLHGLAQNVLERTIDMLVSEATQGKKDEWDLPELWKTLGRIAPINFSVEDFLNDPLNVRFPIDPRLLQTRFRYYFRTAYEQRYTSMKEILNRHGKNGEAEMKNYETRILLDLADRKWIEHLYEMDSLKEQVQQRAHTRVRPIDEYGKEGYKLFQDMQNDIRKEVAFSLFHASISFKSSK